MAPLRKTLDLANAAIDALNDMHGTPTRACVAGPTAAQSDRVSEVLTCIVTCSQQYMHATVPTRGVPDTEDGWDYETKCGTVKETFLQANILSISQ